MTRSEVQQLKYKLKSDRPRKMNRRYSQRMEMAERQYQEKLARDLRKYLGL